MTSMQTKHQSDEARAAYRALRHQQLQARAARGGLALPGAKIEAIIDPADVTGMLNGPKIKLEGLKVNIPIWANVGTDPGDDQLLELFMAPGHITDPLDPSFVLVSDIPKLVWPFAPTWVGDYTIPLAKISPDGPYTFMHRVTLHNTANETSPLIHITSDIIAPYELASQPEPPAMTFTTDEIDDTNKGSVTGVIPDYPDKKSGDKFVYWYAKDPLPEDPTTLLPVAPPTDLPADRQVTIPQTYIEGLVDGIFYVLYALIDVAGNRSHLSGWKRFKTTLGALPEDLKKPQVPVAAGGAVIDYDTAVEGVVVHTLKYTGWKSGDKIIATFGGIALPETYAVESDDTEIAVPAQTLRNAYKNASGTGAKNITVSYHVDRLGRAFGPEQDGFMVDLSIIGPGRPDPDDGFPDITNPALTAGKVKGSTADNVLVEADAEQEVSFAFKIYTPVLAQETVQFFWEGTLVSEATHTMTTEAPGTDATVKFPWRYVAETDNGTGKEVFYTIGSATTPNRQKSRITLVNVDDAIKIKPEAPTFVGVTGSAPIICDSRQAPDGAIVVKVPDLSKWLAAGDVVKMSWKLFNGRSGSVPRPDTELDEDLTLGGVGSAYPVGGFEWRIPYLKHVAPGYVSPADPDSNAKVTYGFTFNSKPVTSIELKAWVAFYQGSGPCPVYPVTP